MSLYSGGGGVKAVHDLEWVMASPHLLTSEYDVLPPSLCSRILNASSTKAWLEGLHADPAPLHAFLGQQRRRSDKMSLDLGVYFTSLVEYWLRECPAFGTERLASGASPAQLKFVFRLTFPLDDPTSPSSDLPSPLDMHWEVAVKFFLLCGPPDGQVTMADFINLGLTAGGETLESRVTKLQRKLRMCSDASTSRWLAGHFAQKHINPNGNQVIQSHVILRGYLYYPLAHLPTTATPPTLKLPPSAINDAHLHGWWTADFENDLVRTTPTTSRFAVLPKLFWLTKVSAPCIDDHTTVFIPGDPGLHMPSIPVVTRDDLFASLRAHFASSPTAKPLVVAELRLVDDGNAATFVEVSRGAIVNAAMWQPTAPIAEKTTRNSRRREKKPSRPSKAPAVVEIDQASGPADVASQIRLAIGSGMGYAAVKARTERVLQHHDVQFAIQCIVALAAHTDHADKNETFRSGQLVMDATLAVFGPSSNHDGGILDTALVTILADEAKWWTVRFLVKAKQVLLGDARASAADDLELESTEDDGCLDGHFVEGVMEVMLEPGHGGKWHATVVDLCGAYALPRSDARAATVLATLLDANDPVAAEAFVLSQQKHRSSQSQQLTQTFVSHPNTPAKAAKRLASLSSQGPHSHRSQATGSQPIVDADHQLSLVQSVLATRLTVHLVESPRDVSAMMAWIDETLVDPNHPSPAGPSTTSETKVVVVGLDCEWRPRAFSAKHLTEEEDPDVVQVVQLAFPHGHVFVVDCAAPSVLDALVAVFHQLSRPWVAVTGFCVTGDLDRVVASCPALTGVVHSPDFRCVELRRVALARATAADVHAVQRTGLAGLAASYLHLTIPKDQQTSDWAVRPLTADQIEYAALDAHCVRLLLFYFTAGLDGMHPIQDPWTISTAMWESWRVHPQAYLGEKDVAAAVASLGLTGSFHTLPRGGVDGHVVIKTVAWTLHPSRQDDGGSTAQIQHVAVVLDLAKTIDMSKLHAFVRSAFPDHSSCTAALASERELLLVFGYSRGCIGPVGLRRQSLVHVVIDASLVHADAIYCGAGALHRVVALSPSQLLQSRHPNTSAYDVAV